jgi:hypothetical protein
MNYFCMPENQTDFLQSPVCRYIPVLYNNIFVNINLTLGINI